MADNAHTDRGDRPDAVEPETIAGTVGDQPDTPLFADRTAGQDAPLFADRTAGPDDAPLFPATPGRHTRAPGAAAPGATHHRRVEPRTSVAGPAATYGQPTTYGQPAMYGQPTTYGHTPGTAGDSATGGPPPGPPPPDAVRAAAQPRAGQPPAVDGPSADTPTLAAQGVLRPAGRRPRAGGTSPVRSEVVGVVECEVSRDSREYTFWGTRALAAATFLAVLVAVVRVLLDGVHTVRHLQSLAGPLLVMVAFMVIYRILLGPPAGRAAGLVARNAGRSVAGAGRLTARGVRGGLRVAGTGTASSVTGCLPLRRFRVRELTGRVVPVVLRGDLVGDEIRRGDIVRVVGRSCPDGLDGRRLEILATPAGPATRTVTVRLPGRFLLTRWGSRVCFVLAALTVLWTVVPAAGLSV